MKIHPRLTSPKFVVEVVLRTKLFFVFWATGLSLWGGPIFWDHPNVDVSFLEPSLGVGQVGLLSLDQLIKESPQDEVWYTGGLVGYFSNEWKAPVWTTPRVEWISAYDDSGLDPYAPPVVVVPPGVPPIVPPVVTPPVEPPPYVPPVVLPPSYEHPLPPQPPVTPPDGPVHPPNVPGHPPDAISSVPEPGTWGMLALGVAGMALAARRRKG